MKVIDAVSKSGLFGAGPTTGEYTHTPTGTPRAALVLVCGWEKNAIDVTAVSYGGSAMTKLQENIPGTTPFPYTAIWLLDNCPQGPQTVKVTKVELAKVRVFTLTLNATGAVSKDAGNGGGGTNTTAGIPALTPGGNSRLAVGVNLVKLAGSPVTRTNGLVESFTEGELTAEVVACELPLGGSALSMEWTWPEAVVNARSGVMLSVPGVEEPAGRVFTADGEPGRLTQWPFMPALVGRISVVSSPIRKGGFAFQFERREGDALIASGNRCEAQSDITYSTGTERWFEFWRYVSERDTAHWCLFWQLHDQGGESPPECLIEEGGTLFFGPGSGTNWWFEGPAQEVGTWRHYKTFIKVHATEGRSRLWLNGRPQSLKGGGSERTGLNTAGLEPVYDKIGIYRSSSATGTTRVIVDDYRVSSVETPPEATSPLHLGGPNRLVGPLVFGAARKRESWKH